MQHQTIARVSKIGRSSLDYTRLWSGVPLVAVDFLAEMSSSTGPGGSDPEEMEENGKDRDVKYPISDSLTILMMSHLLVGFKAVLLKVNVLLLIRGFARACRGE